MLEGRLHGRLSADDRASDAAHETKRQSQEVLSIIDGCRGDWEANQTVTKRQHRQRRHRESLLGTYEDFHNSSRIWGTNTVSAADLSRPRSAATHSRPERFTTGSRRCRGLGYRAGNRWRGVARSRIVATGLRLCKVRRSETIFDTAKRDGGSPLPEAIVRFNAGVFEAGGAVLSGPVGGRHVYDLRRQFDLFCKLVPVRPWPQLARSAQIAADELARVDMLIVRDNAGGVYQGRWETRGTPAGQVAEHAFSYSEKQVFRLAEVAARAAMHRRGRLHIVVKDAGLPSISALWREVGEAVSDQYGLEARFMNVDLAAYELIHKPSVFDVVLTPNLFGDILVDVTGALLGSRGVTFSGNFDAAGNGVYQTNHGCALDLTGADVANPAGQMLSLAMLLRESFGLDEAAALIERALAGTWALGWRTADVAEAGCRVVGTKAMAEQVARQV